jgi:hypothetical protein
MRRLISALALVLLFIPSGPAAAGDDDLPASFAGCVLEGGELRRVGDRLTCRLMVAWDFRVYYLGTTECGEEVELESWGETRGGVMTTLFAPHLTVELPEDERALTDIGVGTPIPCLDD